MTAKSKNMCNESLLNSTSIPGIFHAFKSKDYILRKLVWLFLFGLGLSLTFLQVEQLLTDYRRYPVTTKVSVLDSSTQKFPAVTVCPLQPIKCERFIDYAAKYVWNKNIFQERQKIYCDVLISSGCAAFYVQHPDADANVIIKSKIDIIESSCVLSELPKAGDVEALTKFYKGRKFWSTYHHLGHSERLAIGATEESMIRSCSFADIPCKEKFKRLEVLNNIFVGNCFTFNANDEIGLVRNGPGFSLKVTLYIGLENNPRIPFNDKEGFRIAIHEPGEKPLVNEQGIDISPAMWTRFGIRLTEFHHQPPPYTSKCVSGWNEVNITFVANATEGYSYTQPTCSRLCTLSVILEICNCIYPPLDEFNLQEKFNVDYCTVAQEHIENCADRIFYGLEWKNESTLCNCKPSCVERTYDALVAASKWPSEESWIFKAEKLKINYTGTIQDIMKNKTVKNMAMNLVRSNLAQVQIFFRSTRTELKVEEKKYDGLLALFTELGGLVFELINRCNRLEKSSQLFQSIVSLDGPEFHYPD